MTDDENYIIEVDNSKTFNLGLYITNEPNECPNCFILENKVDKDDKDLHKLCAYCQKHPNMSITQRLDRYFDVMGETLAYRSTIIMKLMWKEIKKK